MFGGELSYEFPERISACRRVVLVDPALLDLEWGLRCAVGASICCELSKLRLCVELSPFVNRYQHGKANINIMIETHKRSLSSRMMISIWQLDCT